MSRVFVAHDRALGRTVAVKVFSPEVAAEVKTERFRLEIQLAAKLQHPHIVPLLFAGENRGVLYFTMPYIDGESLRAKLAREGPLPMPEAIRTLRQIASALAYAHKQGVVHRDIKPDNVLLSGEFALVTDFGVAKALSASTTADGPQLTSSGMTIGTPAYMSPEQALADPLIDHRADIYAFGVVAYEVLAGAPPFSAKTAQATLAAHIVELPKHIATHRSDIPEPLATLVMRCLEKRPEDRPQAATDLLQIFDALGTGSAPHVSLAVPPPPAPGPRPHRRRWIGGAVTVAALAVIGWFALKPGGSGASTDLSSIAVLPLENQGTTKEDEYFSDGMTDELASALSKIPGVRVASRTSAYAFKGTRTNIEEIGRKLNVQAVIEGTVRRSGDRLRVSAQLTSVRDGLTLWSDVYDRETRDVFAVQDDIARSIAAALKPRIGTGRSASSAAFAPESQGTTDLEAYDLYLRGRFLWNARGAENLRRAISYFDSAIARDPKFARAYAARAIAYALLPEYTDRGPADASLRANSSARTALSLDPNLAEAYAALGLAGVHDWKFREAEAAYRMAIEVDPRYPTGHQWYGELLFHTGRIDSSLVQIRMAAELDPLAPIIPAALSYGLTQAGKLDEAVSVLKEGIELAPNLGLHHGMLGIVYLRKGDNRRAIQSFEEAVRLDPELAVRQGYLAYGYAKTGNRARAQQIVDRLEARRRTERVPPVTFLVAYLGLGEYDKALDALEQAARQHDVSLFSVSSLVPDEIYDPVRSNPRFIAVLKEMNLWEYVTQK